MPSTRRDIHNSELPVVCQACEARHQGVCGALSPTQLTELSKHTRRTTLDAATQLLADQEPITEYANILSGIVKLTKIMADGRQQIVGLQFAPDFLGRPFKEESDVFAESATEVTLCSFSKFVRDRIASEYQK